MNTVQSGAVCIDIGGTYIKSGLLENGRLCDLAETPTPPEGGEAVVRAAAAIVARYPGARQVGVSTAGEVDADTGAIRYAVNIPAYTGLPVKGMLQQMTGLPVAVENDVNAAALGEMQFGAGRDEALRSFIMVSYGTGIGGAVVINGELLRGATGSAGEIGGLITHPEAAVSGKAGSGSYERYASTTALVQRTARLSPELDNGRAVFAAMEKGPVRMIVQRWVDEMAYGLVGAIHLLNPQAVVLCGGIMQEDELCERLTQRVLSLLKPTFADTRLLKAKLGGQAPLYGAGLLAGRAGF